MKPNYFIDGILQDLEVWDWVITKEGKTVQINHDDMTDLNAEDIARFATLDEILKEEHENKENWGVHQSHCCKDHGCKYGDPYCPVINDEVIQDHPCEMCSWAEQDRERLNDSLEELVKNILNDCKLSVDAIQGDDPDFIGYLSDMIFKWHQKN